MKITIPLLVILIHQLLFTAVAQEGAAEKLRRATLPILMGDESHLGGTKSGVDNRQDLYRLCEPCEKYIDEFFYTKKELSNNLQQVGKQRSKLKELDREISELRVKGEDAKSLLKKEAYQKEAQNLKKLEEQRLILLSTHERNENNLLKCMYQHCMDKDYADTDLDWNYTVWDSGWGDSKEYDFKPAWEELTIEELYQTLPIHSYYGRSPVPKRYLLTITDCKNCKHRSKEINNWILENYNEKLSLADNLREENYTEEKAAVFAAEARDFITIVEKKRAELRECEKQCIKKDKSHGSVFPDKRKIHYYAAAGVSHVKSEDLRESINAGKEIFAANGIDGDFESESHDLGYRIILGFEVPLENGSIVDVSVFFQDGITIRGDVSGTAATIVGPFTFDSTGKQEIKTYGIDFSFLYRLTPSFFLGGGLGYHFFDIVDESNVVTTLNGVITSSVASRDSEHESVVAATAKLRYNFGKRIFLGGDISRTLEEVGFNDDDHITSINGHIGVRF